MRRALASALVVLLPRLALAQKLPELPTHLPDRSDTTGQGLVNAAAATSADVTLRALGPGLPGRILRAALARPHVVLVSPDTGVTLSPGVRVDRTLVIVGGPARVAAEVNGDLVVLGDLYLRPGAAVEGRAVAIGGGAYNSTLATVRGDLLAFRDVEFARVAGTTPAGQLVLEPRVTTAVPTTRIALPRYFGVRIPSYDRIDGLSLAFGPEVVLDTGRVRIEPLVTYRSHLGAVDPGVRAAAELTGTTLAELRAERGTFSNDGWIRGDLSNSLSVIADGTDARNYYRADRVDLRVTRRVDRDAAIFQPYVGALVERSSSVVRDSGATSAPWSLLNRADRREGVLRPNPAVTGGRVVSALAGVNWRAETARYTGRATAQVEQALSVERGGIFTQGTLDAAAFFPVFTTHRVGFLGHAVATTENAPTQRNVYLGGSGTIPSLYLLEQGGNELLWVEARYTIPVPIVMLPLGGPPNFTVRVIAGGAGENRIPALTPNIGLRLSVSALRADYVFDPRGRGRRTFSLGFGLR